jgi:hypothetical protein
MSRSWSSFAHLRVRDSLNFHPLGPLAFVGAVWLALAGQSSRPPAALSSPPVIGALAAAWLLVWLRRLAGSGWRDGVASQVRPQDLGHYD